MTTPTRVDQTILASDPERLGNCYAACIASWLGRPLDEVPHFLEYGAKAGGPEDRTIWWAMACGYMSALGYWPVILASLDDAEPGEIVFVAGPSRRGVLHQVLYRDGDLWHDPHPSRDGLLEITEIEAWRPGRHDHTPTDGAQ